MTIQSHWARKSILRGGCCVYHLNCFQTMAYKYGMARSPLQTFNRLTKDVLCCVISHFTCDQKIKHLYLNIKKSIFYHSPYTVLKRQKRIFLTSTHHYIIAIPKMYQTCPWTRRRMHIVELFFTLSHLPSCARLSHEVWILSANGRLSVGAPQMASD